MHPVYGVCGHQYQEGAPASAEAPQCACGMFAVGRCADDGTWVCGRHGGMYGGDRLLCGSCWARRDQEAKETRERQTQERFHAAPLLTVDVLGRIADGVMQCTTLRVDSPITGAQLASFMLSRVKPEQINLHEPDEQVARTGRWRRGRPDPTVWKTAPGWELEKDRRNETERYLLVDGRQLTTTYHGSRSYTYQTSYQGPGVPVGFDLLRPVLRTHFPVFREIEWLLGDSGRLVGIVTANGGHITV